MDFTVSLIAHAADSQGSKFLQPQPQLLT